MEGKDDRNEVYLELSVEQLARALKSSLGAQVVKLKLTKRHGACLTVEVTQVMGGGGEGEGRGEQVFVRFVGVCVYWILSGTVHTIVAVLKVYLVLVLALNISLYLADSYGGGPHCGA